MKALGGGLSGAAGTFNYHSGRYLTNVRSLAMIIQVLTLMVSTSSSDLARKHTN